MEAEAQRLSEDRHVSQLRKAHGFCDLSDDFRDVINGRTYPFCSKYRTTPAYSQSFDLGRWGAGQ
jgi:hypothetical protein